MSTLGVYTHTGAHKTAAATPCAFSIREGYVIMLADKVFVAVYMSIRGVLAGQVTVRLTLMGMSI